MTREDEATVNELEKKIEDLTKSLAKAVEDAKAASVTAVAEVQKKLDEANEALKKAEDEKKLLVAKASMSSAEKEHCDGMSDSETASFMAKPAAERKKDMTKKIEGDEMITVEGQEIKKSVVGDVQFTIIKAQAARIAKTEADIKAANDKSEMATLAKRADDEFKHVPGTTEERAGMLKAIAAMDEPLRKSFEAVFVQSEKLAKTSFDKVGHGGGGEDLEKKKKNGTSNFEKRVSEIAARDKIGKSEAMSKARSEFSEEFKAYQESN